MLNLIEPWQMELNLPKLLLSTKGESIYKMAVNTIKMIFACKGSSDEVSCKGNLTKSQHLES